MTSGGSGQPAVTLIVTRNNCEDNAVRENCPPPVVQSGLQTASRIGSARSPDPNPGQVLPI